MTRQSLAQIKSKLRCGIWQSTRGATLPMIVASIIPLFGAMGGAVDLANIYMVRSQMRDAVDNAALAGGRLFDSNKRNQNIEEFFNSNLPILANGNTLKSLDITDAKVGGVDQLTVSAEVEVSMLMMKVFGMQTFKVTASATVERSGAGVDLILALDNTDSMTQYDAAGTTPRIEALRTASRALVTQIYGGQPTNDKLSIGVIPYTSMVNIGKLLIDEEVATGNSYIEAMPGYTYNPSDPLGWKGCLDESPTINTLDDSADPEKASDWVGALDTMELKPGVDGQPLFRPFLSPSWQEQIATPLSPAVSCPATYTYNTGTWTGGVEGEPAVFVPGVDVTVEADPTCVPKAADLSKGVSLGPAFGNRYVLPSLWPTPEETHFWWSPVPSTGPAARLYPISSDAANGGSPNMYCPQASMSLKNRPFSEVDSYLASMQAYSYSAGTMSNVAMGWAYRMMTPAAPLIGPPKKSTRQRVIVLMTDGFLWQDSFADIRSPYGFVSQNKIAIAPGDAIDTPAWRAKRYEALAARLKRWCALARDEGIKVYTVSFVMPASDPRSKLYEDCASEKKMYFNTANAADLTKAFEDIAGGLSNLRLVK